MYIEILSRIPGPPPAGEQQILISGEYASVRDACERNRFQLA